MKLIKVGMLLVIVIVLIMGIQSNSYGLAIRLQDVIGGGMVTVFDNIPTPQPPQPFLGDYNGIFGVLSYLGTVPFIVPPAVPPPPPPPTWGVNSTTGISYPIVGSPADPLMDLHDANVSLGAGGIFKVILSDTGFTGPITGGIAGPFDFNVGGTTIGTITFSAYLDDNDMNYWDIGAAPVLLGSGTNVASPFAISFSGSAPASGTFSLTLVADISHPGAGITSFNAELKSGKIPEPMSLILLGSGLAGVGLYRRLRKPKG
jgi:hypothetical protein